MFSKLKSRKVPVTLGAVSNSLKGNKGSLTPENLNSKTFKVEEHRRYGLAKDSVVTVAHDPVQSLMAVSTKDNEIRVFGQSDVEVVFSFKSSLTLTRLMFVKGVYLVGAQVPGDHIVVISLHSRQVLGQYRTPTSLTSVCLDYSLDFIALGLSNGCVMFYDVDRLSITPLRIDNLQKTVMPKEKMSPVMGLEWHPRDIGSILVCYAQCAVWYSLSSGLIKTVYALELTKGLRGFEHALKTSTRGKKKLFGTPKSVLSEVQEAHFHPNGLHVVTVHTDSTLTFWDANNGTLLENRSLTDINLHKEGSPVLPEESYAPIESVKWICSEDPEVTQILITGGVAQSANKIYTMDLGMTLKYSLTSNEKQGSFYSEPSGGIKQIEFNLDNRDESSFEIITEIFPLASEFMPYFSGNQNPTHLIVLSNLGGFYITKFSMLEDGLKDNTLPNLPPSLSLICPPATFSSIQSIPRLYWYGILSGKNTRTKSSKLLQGGALAHLDLSPKVLYKFEAFRNIQITGHENGIIKLRDVSRGETPIVEDELAISVMNVLYDDGSQECKTVAMVSVGFECREILVGMHNGDVLICSYIKYQSITAPKNFNKDTYDSCPVQHSNGDASIYYIKDRNAFSSLFSGFLPCFLLRGNDQKITAIEMSNIGFGAVAYESGRLIVCDISRGPAVILNTSSLSEFIMTEQKLCYITSIKFTIMEFDQEGFSSILLICGTNSGGNLLTFKIVPKQNGAFEAVFAGKILNLNYRRLGGEETHNSRIDHIVPINSSTGESALPTLEAFRNLGKGILIPGNVIISSNKDIRILALPKSKLARKVVEDRCLSTNLISIRDGFAAAAVLKLGFVKIFTLPTLSEVADIKLSQDLFKTLKQLPQENQDYMVDMVFTGDIFLKLSLTEVICLKLCFKDSKSSKASDQIDQLFNENAIIPPRPVTSTLQWAKGNTTYVSVEDLCSLIAGPNRRPAKNIESQLAHNISPEANPNSVYGAPTEASTKMYKEPVRKSTAARSNFGGTGFMRSLQSGLDNVEESFNGYANDFSESVTETISSQKHSLYSAALKDKFGF